MRNFRNQRIYLTAFRRVTGASPIAYFNRLKVQHAASWLLTSNRTVVDIAEELGFKDRYYFSRMFKRSFGLSPRDFRQRDSRRG